MLKQIISGAIAGLIVFLTSIMAIAMGGGPEGQALTNVQDINSIQWLVAGGGGVLAALKDWRALLTPPPPKF